MVSHGAGLARFIREHADQILAAWDRLVARDSQVAVLPHSVLRDHLDRALVAIALGLEAPASTAAETENIAVADHVIQRAQLGFSIAAVASELFALGHAVEATWPGSEGPEGMAGLHGLRRALERLVLATIERFAYVRMRLVDAIHTIVREYEPGRTLDETLTRMLRAMHRFLGVDAVAVLLVEDDLLRVRAAIGPEEASLGFSVRIGEGFAGLIAADGKPRLLRAAAMDPLVVNPALRRAGLRALYGVPLFVHDQLIGVAHIGSLAADDFPPEVQGVFRVVMERVAGVIQQERLREQLDLEQARFRALVDNAPTFIFSKDLEGRYLTINRTALEHFGLTPERFIGHTDREVFPPEIAAGSEATDRLVLERMRPVELEYALARGDERRTLLAIKFPILDALGKPAAIGGVATDITERRRLQLGHELLARVGGMLASSFDYHEMLAELVRGVVPALADCCIVEEVVDEGIWRRVAVYHRDPERADLARALLEIALDRSRPHLTEAVLRSHEPVFMRRIAPAYLDTIAQGQAHLRLLTELDPTSMIQIPLLARGHLFGACVLLRCNGSPGYDEIDFGFAKELGWRVSLALDNARLYAAASAAVRSRDEILGVVAHDLRNPLGSVVLATESLAESLPPGAAFEHKRVAAIERAAYHMEKLVTDLLDQYAIERGEFSVLAQRSAPEHLVRAAAEAHRDRIEAASLSLHLETPESLPPVYADADRVQQVFGNLIANAVKFTPAGGAITIGARAGRGEIELFVRDTGPGFSPEIARHIFERHWRARRSDARGVGLGLAICKGIVEAHHGRIWAESEPGMGTTIRFTLPLAELGDAPAHESPRAH